MPQRQLTETEVRDVVMNALNEELEAIQTGERELPGNVTRRPYFNAEVTREETNEVYLNIRNNTFRIRIEKVADSS